VAERLEDGWQRDTPVGDNLLRAHFLAFADYFVEHGRAHGHATLDDEDVGATQHPYENYLLRAAVARRPPPDPGTLAAKLDDFFGDQRYGVFVPGLVPAPAGMELGGHPPFMVRAAGGSAPPRPSGLRIQEVRDEHHVRDFEAAMVAGYPIAELEGAEPGAGFGPGVLDIPRLRLWVGYEGDRPVATSGTVVAHGLNHIEWISARREVRGRGYGAAMTWQATFADPNLPAVLIASDDGRPVYERMGYLPVLRCTFWLGPRR
jgi:hypothetical protein